MLQRLDTQQQCLARRGIAFGRRRPNSASGGVIALRTVGSDVDAAESRAASDDLRRGVIAGITVYLLWGFLTLYWKLLHRFDAFELIGWRIASSCVADGRAPHRDAALASSDGRPPRPALLLRVAGAAVLLTVNWTSYVYAVVHDHVIETALGYFIAPLGTILIGVVVFREHLGRAQRIAVALAMVALVDPHVSYGRVPWLAVAIAVSWSVYGWMKKQVPLDSDREHVGGVTAPRRSGAARHRRGVDERRKRRDDRHHMADGCSSWPPASPPSCR